jgi:hypothetical protein
MDIAHWEFIGLLFGLALASIEMSGWQMTYLRHGIGILGVLLAGVCVVLLFGFSGAALRSPVSFRWPVVLPSDKPSPAPLPIVSQQVSQPATPTPAYLAEVASLKDENARLKTENSRLKKIKAPRVVAAALPIPSACPSARQVLFPSMISVSDCDALIGAQKLVDSADQDRIGASKDESASEEGRQRYIAAVSTETQAIMNLQSLQARLCAVVMIATPAPTGR